MALITIISTSELTLVFLMNRTLNMNFGDIVAIRVEPLVQILNIKKMTIHKSIEGAQLKSLTSSSPQLTYISMWMSADHQPTNSTELPGHDK